MYCGFHREQDEIQKNYKTASQFGAQHLPSIICDFHSLESVCFPLTVKGTVLECYIVLDILIPR